MTEFRVGQGWDTHRLAEGRKLILGGVEIPSDLGLDGHSDADILSHAITDAILGALALGDIGMHFPDTDPQWKGADSKRFLAHAVALAREHGWAIGNVDASVLLEKPKLKAYRGAIREALAETMGIVAERVSVKFKTHERVGPVGERLSGEAQAVVLLSR